jgi:hypothetical protein
LFVCVQHKFQPEWFLFVCVCVCERERKRERDFNPNHLFVCVQHKFQPEWFLFEREREKDFNPNHLVLCVWCKFQPKSFLFPYHTIKKNNINSMCLMKPWGNKVFIDFFTFYAEIWIWVEYSASSKLNLSVDLPSKGQPFTVKNGTIDWSQFKIVACFIFDLRTFNFVPLTSNSCLVKSRTFLMTFEIWQISERIISF